MRLFFALLLFILSSETKRTSGNIRVLDVSLMPYWTPPEVRLCKAKQRKKENNNNKKEGKQQEKVSVFVVSALLVCSSAATPRC